MTKIKYCTNDELWRLENAAKKAGYKKVQDCYWIQLFENKSSGDSFAAERDESANGEALEQQQHLEQQQPRGRAVYTNLRSLQTTERAAEAMQWHRAGDRVRVERGGRAVDITGAAQKPAADENRSHCRYIAHELEKYARGDVYSCPECGELLELPGGVGDKYRCPHCGTVHELEQLEQLSLYDYFEDCLDIEYRIGGDRAYRSVRVMVACGGPNIYIDTETRAVELYWWGSNARYLIDTDVCEQVDEWAEELFNL